MQDKNAICAIQKCEMRNKNADLRCEMRNRKRRAHNLTCDFGISNLRIRYQGLLVKKKKNRALSAFKMADGEAASAADNIWLISYVAAYFPLCFVSIHAVMENELPVHISTPTFKLENSSLFYPSDFVAMCTFINLSQVRKRNYKLNGIVCHTLPLCCCPLPCHVIAVSQVRLHDHGAWPGISQYFISHLAFLLWISRFFLISHLAFLYLTSRIFISHLALILPPEFFFFCY